MSNVFQWKTLYRRRGVEEAESCLRKTGWQEASYHQVNLWETEELYIHMARFSRTWRFPVKKKSITKYIEGIWHFLLKTGKIGNDEDTLTIVFIQIVAILTSLCRGCSSFYLVLVVLLSWQNCIRANYSEEGNFITYILRKLAIYLRWSLPWR